MEKAGKSTFDLPNLLEIRLITQEIRWQMMMKHQYFPEIFNFNNIINHGKASSLYYLQPMPFHKLNVKVIKL